MPRMPLNMERHQHSNHPERTRCSQRVAIQARIVYTWEIRHNAVVAWFITQGQNEFLIRWIRFGKCPWLCLGRFLSSFLQTFPEKLQVLSSLGKMYNVRINSVWDFSLTLFAGYIVAPVGGNKWPSLWVIRIIHWFINIDLGKNKVNGCTESILPYYSSRKTVHDKISMCIKE